MHARARTHKKANNTTDPIEYVIRQMDHHHHFPLLTTPPYNNIFLNGI